MFQTTVHGALLKILLSYTPNGNFLESWFAALASSFRVWSTAPRCRIRLTSIMSLGMIVMRFTWITHKFESLKYSVMNASDARCSANRADPCHLIPSAYSFVISQTSLHEQNLQCTKITINNTDIFIHFDFRLADFKKHVHCNRRYGLI